MPAGDNDRERKRQVAVPPVVADAGAPHHNHRERSLDGGCVLKIRCIQETNKIASIDCATAGVACLAVPSIIVKH